jgi:hypothetical protein
MTERAKSVSLRELPTMTAGIYGGANGGDFDLGADDLVGQFVSDGFSYGQKIIVVPDARLIVVTVSDDSGPEPTEKFYNTMNDVILRPILA